MIVEKKVRNCLVSRVTDPNGVQIGVAELSDELEEEEEGDSEMKKEVGTEGGREGGGSKEKGEGGERS